MRCNKSIWFLEWGGVLKAVLYQISFSAAACYALIPCTVQQRNNRISFTSCVSCWINALSFNSVLYRFNKIRSILPPRAQTGAQGGWSNVFHPYINGRLSFNAPWPKAATNMRSHLYERRVRKFVLCGWCGVCLNSILYHLNIKLVFPLIKNSKIAARTNTTPSA